MTAFDQLRSPELGHEGQQLVDVGEIGRLENVWYAISKAGRMAMDKCLLLGATLLLVSCNSDRSPSAENLNSSDHSAADANNPDVGAQTRTMSLLNTTWEFDDNGKPTVITIDKAGTYIENRADGTHVVHGTYVQKGGRDCFTSAMGDKSISCWTAVPPVEIGETATATSENGGSAVFKRVAYRDLQLPR